MATADEVHKTVKKILLFKNPFDILGSLPEDSNEDIHKKYKKLALVVHPDKCKHPDAVEAFASLNKALKLIEKEEGRKFYADLMKKAEDEIKEEWASIGRKRRRESDEIDFRDQVQKKTQKLMIEVEYSNRKAEEFKLKNERRVKEEEIRMKEEIQKQSEIEKEWEETRVQRVESWRSFQAKGPVKKVAKKGPLKPPKVKLNDSGNTLKSK